MPESVQFKVAGVARPQGSKNQFGVEASRHLKPWREDVRWTAIDAMKGRKPLTGPVELYVNFVFRWPKSFYRANGEVKEGAPIYKTSKPDLDKLLRGVADAITHICVEDDSQFVVIRGSKMYSMSDYAFVVVSSLSPDPFPYRQLAGSSPVQRSEQT